MPDPPGNAKFANAPPLGLTRWANAPQLPGGGGWAQLELTDALLQNNNRDSNELLIVQGDLTRMNAVIKIRKMRAI